MKAISTFEDLYRHVEEGEKVVWKNPSYEVKKSTGVFIICHIGGSVVGLYEPDYSPTDFYIIQ